MFANAFYPLFSSLFQRASVVSCWAGPKNQGTRAGGRIDRSVSRSMESLGCLCYMCTRVSDGDGLKRQGCRGGCVHPRLIWYDIIRDQLRCYLSKSSAVRGFCASALLSQHSGTRNSTPVKLQNAQTNMDFVDKYI
jgi:hypothetical protein